MFNIKSFTDYCNRLSLEKIRELILETYYQTDYEEANELLDMYMNECYSEEDCHDNAITTIGASGVYYFVLLAFYLRAVYYVEG